MPNTYIPEATHVAYKGGKLDDYERLKELTSLPDLTSQDVIEAKNLLRDNKCVTFVPNGKGEEFIRLIGQQKLGEGSIFVFSAANDCQKSTTLVQIIINLVYPEILNPWFDLPFFREFKRPCRLRLGSDPTTVEKKLVPELKKWLPKGTYRTFKGRKPYEYEWTFEGGATLDLLTYEQDPKEWESVDLDGVFLDEPVSYEIYAACIARMRERIFMVMTLTPLVKADWLVDKFSDPMFRFVYADAFSNCRCCGVRGIREHASIVEKIAQYDPDEKEARAYGKFMILQGIVYKSFNRDTHVIPRKKVEDNWVLGMTVDPHASKPFFIGWWAITPRDEIVFIDEYPKADFDEMKRVRLSIPEYYNIIRDTELNFPTKVKYRLMDPNAGESPDLWNGLTIKDQLKQYEKSLNIPLRERMSFDTEINDDVDARILAVKTRLNYDKNKPMDGSNQPTLLFFDNCRNLVKHMSKWMHREWKQQQGKSTSERVEDKYRDGCDVVGYTCIKKPLYRMPKGGSYRKVPIRSYV